MELRLHQTGELHRVGKIQILDVLLQQGHHIGMGPLVRPPGRHRHHRRFGLELFQQLPGGGIEGGMVGHLQNVTRGQVHGLPHMGVGVAAQNDLLAV